MGTLSRRVPRLAVVNGQPTTTSREIAASFGKDHKAVTERIRKLECSEAFRSANFSAHPYTIEQNGETYTEYRITKDGFAFLCMGFTGPKAAQFKERYISRFNAMAEKLAKKQPKQPLAHTEPAQSAIKQIAFDPASLIGKGLPPLPAGLEFPPELRQQIDQAVLQQAILLTPALRSYLERRLAHTAHNASGWIPHLIAPSLAAASLQDALAHQATQARENAISTLSALNIITAQALERVRGEGSAA